MFYTVEQAITFLIKPLKITNGYVCQCGEI